MTYEKNQKKILNKQDKNYNYQKINLRRFYRF